MASWSGWIGIVVSGLVGAFVTQQLVAYTRRRDQLRPTDRVIRYERPWKIAAFACLAISAFIVYAALHAAPGQRHIAYPLSGTLVVVSIYFLIEVFFVRVSFDDDFVYAYSPWRGHRTIPWAAVEGYHYSHLAQWHVIETRGFGTLRLYVSMNGLDEFGEMLMSKLDASTGSADQ